MAELTQEELENKEIELDKREASLATREREVSQLEVTKAKLEKDYRDKDEALKRKEADILTEKTNEISKAKKELSSLNEQISEISKQIIQKNGELEVSKATIDSQLNTYKNEKIEVAEKTLADNFKKQMDELKSSYEYLLTSSTDAVKWSDEKLKKAFDQLTDEFKKLLESKEKAVQLKIDDLEKAKEECEKAIEETSHIKELEQKLNLREKKLAQKEKLQENIIESEVKKRAAETEQELNKYKELYEDILAEKNELGKRNIELRDSIQYAEVFDKLKLNAENEKLSKDIQELTKKYAQYSSTEFNELQAKANQFDTLAQQNTKLNLDNSELQRQLDMLKSSNNNAESLRYQKEQLENTIRVERLVATELNRQIDDLSSRLDGVKTGVIASESIEAPYKDFENCQPSDKTSINEIEWIDSIISKCKESGYEFSKRLFYSFHTSLKTADMSPLTVLAGVSGTGKSKLPQLYSRFGGLYFISIPVQPDWDSPQSLFGYFNSIEKRFNATSLLRALVSFQADKSKSATKDKIMDLSNHVLIVLLDEMNLAHVELYFADLLSKLEEKRGENKNTSFEVDLGAGQEKYSVVLTDNVKWIGTMNEDETTKSLSDKVVDRGNVISFPRPERFERYNYNQLKPEEPKIQRQVWESWTKDKYRMSDEEANHYMEIVEGINDALKNVNRALGHRVWQSIEDYMISHPLVNQYKKDDNKRNIALNYAFEEALVYKVMTKLRGIDTTGVQKEECLDKIQKLLSDNGLTTILPDFENAMHSVTETFIWDSAKYLAEDYKME